MRRSKRRKQRKIIIISFISMLFIITVGYAAFQTDINITAKGNIIEKSRTIQSWTTKSNEDFHTDFYKQNIKTITFLDNNKVPSNATESWDVSETKDKGVTAYVVQSTSEIGKYDLYIGANKGVIANKNSNYLFQNFINVTSISFDRNFDTSNVISMDGMFNQCWELETLDLSSFNTINVTSMKIMFMGCNNLTELDLSNFDTRNLNDMNAMFSMWNNEIGESSTGKLTEIKLTGFNTSKVTSMKDLFSFNRNLKTIIGLEQFDTANVTNMLGMFRKCESLTTLNLCTFNTKKVTNMWGMFASTLNLNQVKVGINWDVTNANNASTIFDSSKISSVTTGQC